MSFARRHAVTIGVTAVAIVGAIVVGAVSARYQRRPSEAIAERMKSMPAGAARVECAASQGPGFVCSVTHSSGPDLEVCFDVVVRCENGARGVASRCAEVRRGATTTATVPHERFGVSLDNCDQFASVSVDVQNPRAASR